MADRNPRYGFAHRVNDWDVIVDALDATSGGGNVAGNGIEFDLGWSTFYNDWTPTRLTAARQRQIVEWMAASAAR